MTPATRAARGFLLHLGALGLAPEARDDAAAGGGDDPQGHELRRREIHAGGFLNPRAYSKQLDLCAKKMVIDGLFSGLSGAFT